MKNLWKSLGKAIVYFLIYLIMQAGVSGIYSTVVTMRLTAEMLESDGSVDMELLTAKAMEVIMPQMMTLTLISGVLTLLVLIVVFLIRKKNIMKEACIRPMPALGIVPVAFAAIGLNIVSSVLFLRVIPFPESWMTSYRQSAGALSAGNMGMAFVTAVILAPVLEEIVFRGLIYTRLKQGMPVLAAAVIASLFFALAHGSIVWGCCVFVLSMALIFVFERYQSLTACIVFHLFYNLTAQVLNNIGDIPSMVLRVMFVAAWVALLGGMVFIFRKKE